MFSMGVCILLCVSPLLTILYHIETPLHTEVSLAFYDTCELEGPSGNLENLWQTGCCQF